MSAGNSSHPPENQTPVSEAELSRRTFLARLSIALGLGSAVALVVPMIGFILGPLFRRNPTVWRAVGKVDSFKIGETVAVTYEDASALPWAGLTSRTAAWLRREDENRFIAFSINCSHLGCPVRWMPEANLFMCPCHGGVYYSDGNVAAGPPPKPLTRYRVRIKNQQVEIETGPISIT